jgi:putative ABC transport system substrate-binding protein
MKRRTFCAALAGGLATRALAQAQPASPLHISWVSIERAGAPSPFLEAFRGGMRDLGYVEGRNLVIDIWWGEGSAAALAPQVDRIVQSRPRVIVAQGGLALQPLLDARVPLPIVFAASMEPVEAGIARSLAHPGGNVTGMTFFALDLIPKRIEIMKEALPAMKRVALVGDPQHPGQPKELAAAQVAASRLPLDVTFFPVHRAEELETALTDIARNRYDALLAIADGFTQSFAARFASFCRQTGIPTVGGWSQFAREGNLMTYGPVLADCYRRLASFVDRINRGARPGDLPIELPTKVELVINLKTARNLGITLPQTLLVRADELIE